MQVLACQSKAALHACASIYKSEHISKENSYDRVLLPCKVRMILLLEYGGLWVDVDTVFLRDLSPFWPYEWAERWSLHPAHNTAMLRLFAGSKIGKRSA